MAPSTIPIKLVVAVSIVLGHETLLLETPKWSIRRTNNKPLLVCGIDTRRVMHAAMNGTVQQLSTNLAGG